jgi:ubiquinone/menaquinone biosynthesis C-methylase UbiE
MTNDANVATATTNTAPEAYLTQLSLGALISQALYVAAKLGIADLLAREPQPVAKLATATNSNEQALYRVLRSLAGAGVFQEIKPRTFALTPNAEPLRSDAPKSMRSGMIFMGEEWHWRVWGNMIESVKDGNSAWGKVHGVEVFDYFQANPEQYEIFNRAMTDMTAGTAPAIVEAYDFSSASTVADIAGGHGFLLSAILKANPKLNGILFDVPVVIEGARKLLDDKGVSDRVKTVEGDFFQSVPAGADLYLLKHIIHDWDDERAAKILANIRDAMDANGRVLVVEVVLPEGNEPHFGKLMDLEMLVSPGGVERTADEYHQLLESSGLRMTKIIPTKSAYSMIEAVKR